jgi:hypothetical protein
MMVLYKMLVVMFYRLIFHHRANLLANSLSSSLISFLIIISRSFSPTATTSYRETFDWYVNSISAPVLTFFFIALNITLPFCSKNVLY